MLTDFALRKRPLQECDSQECTIRQIFIPSNLDEAWSFPAGMIEMRVAALCILNDTQIKEGRLIKGNLSKKLKAKIIPNEILLVSVCQKMFFEGVEKTSTHC